MNEIAQTSLEQYAAEYIELRGNLEHTKWALADICAAVKTHYGEKSVIEFCDILDKNGVYLKPPYFYDLARTAIKFADEEIRLKYNLSFSFFKVAARTTRPEFWLGTAEDNHWSLNRLEEEISHEKTQSRPVPQLSVGGAGENSLAVSSPFSLFVFEIQVADDNLQVFEKGLERLRTQYTAVEPFLFNVIMRKGREL